MEVARLLWGRGGGGVVEKNEDEDEDEHNELDGKQENKTPYIIPDVVLAADVVRVAQSPCAYIYHTNY